MLDPKSTRLPVSHAPSALIVFSEIPTWGFAVGYRYFTATRFYQARPAAAGGQRSQTIPIRVNPCSSAYGATGSAVVALTFAPLRPWRTKLKGEMGRSLLCVSFFCPESWKAIGVMEPGE